MKPLISMNLRDTSFNFLSAGARSQGWLVVICAGVYTPIISIESGMVINPIVGD